MAGAALLAAGVAACTASRSGGGGGEVGSDGPASLVGLGIPLNAVPGPGSCRIWRPTSPAVQQMGPGPCERLTGRVGEGGWLLRHPVPPEGEPHRIHLVVYGEDGPSLVRVFERSTGTLVRERTGGDGPDAARDREGKAEDRTAAAADGGARRGGAPPDETLYRLGIPKGAVPPGRCRIWDPDLGVPDQAPAGPCDELRVEVEGDDWLLHHRSAEDFDGNAGRLVVAVHEDGRVVAIRVFDVETGALIEERTRR